MPVIDLRCRCGQPFMSVNPAPGHTGEQLRARYKKKKMMFRCDACGRVYRMVDDTIAASAGGSVTLAEMR